MKEFAWWGTSAARGGIDFSHLKIEDLPGQVDAAIEHARKEIASIRADSSPSKYRNVVERLDQATEQVDEIELVIHNLLSVRAVPELEKLSTPLLSKIADFTNEIMLDGELFKKVEAAHQGQESERLGEEERELLDRYYRDFVRNGVGLPANQQVRLKELDRELTAATRKYEEQSLEATRRFELYLTSPLDVNGLPETWLTSASAEATKRGKHGGWIVTLQYPSLNPFMTFADRRDLREQVWRAANSRGLGKDLNNAALAEKIASLRFERARLLGFDSHAHYTLTERMAQRPEIVRKFLDDIIERSKKPAEKELELLKKESGLGNDFQPWDTAYWAERLKKRTLCFDDEQLRPYFPMDAVWAGLQKVARKLYNVDFKKVEGVPVYDPDVTTWEVWVDGKEVGLLYLDLFPRDTKQSGAWATCWREPGKHRGKYLGPHVGVACNFPRPTPGQPSLLSPQDVNTFFHEMGHALHALCSKGQLRTVAGFNVYWDFVELPSQIMEAWATHPDSVATFAEHWQTQEKPSRALLEGLQRSDQFLKGLFWMRQMRFAETDWAWHGGDPSRFGDFSKLEQAVRAKADLYPAVDGAAISSFFNHIFGGGYAAGYYSYAWADVLAADAFEAFTETGDIFNSNVARRFREEILEKGGSRHPAELYRSFRGRDADPSALLRRDGLTAGT
jgi:peptidyl-dipeptidase Dcp